MLSDKQKRGGGRQGEEEEEEEEGGWRRRGGRSEVDERRRQTGVMGGRKTVEEVVEMFLSGWIYVSWNPFLLRTYQDFLKKNNILSEVVQCEILIDWLHVNRNKVTQIYIVNQKQM